MNRKENYEPKRSAYSVLENFRFPLVNSNSEQNRGENTHADGDTSAIAV